MRRAWSGLVVLIFTSAIPAALSCSSEPDARLVALDKRVRAEQLRLDDILKKVAEVEARAATARAEAEYQRCRAEAGELRAETQRRRAMCAKDVADRNLCLAMNSKQAAESTLSGCAFGILLGALSGGAAAPWALGGCAVGVGEATAVDCPSIACTQTLRQLPSQVLSDRHLDAFPHCGGYFGLALRPSEAIALAAVRIDSVAPGSTAQSASMARGDALFAIEGQDIRSAADIEQALKRVQPGTAVRMSVIRDDQWLALTGTASRRTTEGQIDDKVRLGATVGEAIENVRYGNGVAVAAVDPQSPAEGALRAGDVVLEVNTRSPLTNFDIVRSPEALEQLLEAVRANQAVTFKLQRAAQEIVVELRAGSRGPHRLL